MPPILTARGVEKEYIDGERRLAVLGGIDLEVGEGEFLAIVGQSGSGKSTLLHVLGALDRPTAGSVTLQGTEYRTLNDRELARVRCEKVGFVFQFHHLLPEFTALENVMMPGLIARANQGDTERRANELLARVGLAQRTTHRPAKLSGGEQQRVSLARALLNNPMVVLADEPTGNLDHKTAGEVMEFMVATTVKAGKSLVIVTHDREIAARADRTLSLAEGRLASAY